MGSTKRIMEVKGCLEYRPLPWYFSSSGSCYSAACANAVNHLENSHIVSGENVLNEMVHKNRRDSSDRGAIRALTRMREMKGLNIDFEYIDMLKGILFFNRLINKVDDSHQLIFSVDIENWEHLVTSNGARSRRRLLKPSLFPNHVILLFGSEKNSDEKRVSVFDRNYGFGLGIPIEWFKLFTVFEGPSIIVTRREKN